MLTLTQPANWPAYAPSYFSPEGWEWQKEQAAKAWKRFLEKKAEIKNIETLPYYTIFGSEAERRADKAKAELIAKRIYDKLMAW